MSQMKWKAVEQPDELDVWHHGIKGMKWGVRRTPEQLGYKTSKKKVKWTFKTPAQRREEAYQKKVAQLSKQEEAMTKKEEIRSRENALKRRKEELKNAGKTQAQLNAEKKTDASKKRNVSEMTDDELRNFINRYNLEQSYKKIMESGNTKKGDSWVTTMLKDSGKKVAATYTQKAMTAAVEAILNQMKKKRQNNNNSGNSGGGGGGGNP